MADMAFWDSNDRGIWLNKLDKYWDYVKPANRALEIEMEHLDESQVRKMPVQKFYNFLYEKYFVWSLSVQDWNVCIAKNKYPCKPGRRWTLL